jgi:hypothetical protein
MKRYSTEVERKIRARNDVREWIRSKLLDKRQAEKIETDLTVDYRQTNGFLRALLFGFGILIIGASVLLTLDLLDATNDQTVGTICLAFALACVAIAETLIGVFRLYRFGVEEAAAAAAVGLSVIGVTVWWEGGSQEMVGFTLGAVTAFTAYRRYGYRYAAVASMGFATAVPFELITSRVSQRILAIVILACVLVFVRMKRRKYGDDFPGDDYGIMQAFATVGVYVLLNLQLFTFAVPTTVFPSSFYWSTYVAIWLIPVAVLGLGIRDRDRPLIDCGLAMLLATMVTNKPYLHMAEQSWDPILFGLLLVGSAVGIRRWLTSNPDGHRDGFTPIRIVDVDKRFLSAIGTASTILHAGTAPQPTADPNRFEPGGGRSGGGGATGSM